MWFAAPKPLLLRNSRISYYWGYVPVIKWFFPSKSHFQFGNLQHKPVPSTFLFPACLFYENKQIFKNAKQHKQAVPEGSLPSLLPRKMEFSSGVSKIVCILSLPLKWLSQNAKGIFYYQALFDAQRHEKNVLRFPLIMFRNKEKRKKLAFNSRFNLKILCPLKRKETCLV